MSRDSYAYIRPILAKADALRFPDFVPLSAPPIPATLPNISTRTPTWLPAGWHHSTHIAPAAYPRISPVQDIPTVKFDGALDRESRQKILVDAQGKLMALREAELKKWPTTRDEVLWICMNRYVRRQRGGQGVTLFLAHANGFNKEIWEPMLKRLLSQDKTVSEIWVWEATNHGDSALLNAGKLNTMSHWHEHTRDLLNIIAHYLPANITVDLPLHLPGIFGPDRFTHGFSSRKLVMVGHSFGGCISTLAAILHPALFDALFLLDPVILEPKSTPRQANALNTLALGALGRRDVWKSRKEAGEQMRRNPFFQRWHPDVLDAYLTHGLYDTADGQVTLKTPKLSEATAFSDTWTGGEETWVRLYRGELDERIETRWLVPGRGEVELGGPGQTHPRVWLRGEKNNSNVIMEGAGHLIPHEKPDDVADELAAFIERKYTYSKSKL
ncbi:alpha/beta-hydrolase [Cylindrobasidium torrendii FP15055 ss-10]|uniref:Alpha/beta-hydrolase n=1 Tax=Cylindrobasidium torrendii FP15055 ss-10 TaxID=1314674 RepID=A0A0D7BIH9_9AGAR|nr:alpha/beta-hydrolase [Cylindrobasidium torrendii FP15055 ss-10]